MSYKEKMTEVLFNCTSCCAGVTHNDMKGDVRITDCRVCPHCGHIESMLKRSGSRVHPPIISRAKLDDDVEQLLKKDKDEMFMIGDPDNIPWMNKGVTYER